MSANGCPDRDELARFAVGDLDGSDLTRVAGHVEHCPACESALQTLDTYADPLVTGLRRSSVEAVGDVPPELLAAARSALGAQPAAEAHSGPPRRVGQFELIEEVGSGTFGSVYRALDTELGREVAVKVLRAGRLARGEDVERFLREARSAARLQHPGIVSLHQAGQTPDGVCYLVEELVRGVTLAERLKGGPLDPRAAAGLIADVAEALDAAHQLGVIHRDVKPSNIMLADRQSNDSRLGTGDGGLGTPKVTDFGLAKWEAEDATMTPEGEVLGTPAYMSPEQARGESHRVDARSDVYSLGVVLYEAMTGERPFRGSRRMLILQVLQDEPRPPRRLNDKIPRDLETICLKAMAKTPARRYATAGELAADLRRFIAHVPIKARPVGLPGRAWRWCRRNPVPAGLLAALSVGSAVGLWHLSRLNERMVRSTALDGAAQQAETLECLNDLYSEAVDRALPQKKVLVTHDYAERKDSLPLPATLTIDLGKRISERSETGMQVRLYSDHPWKFRTNGGPADEFERETLRRLRENPDEPVYRFEEYQGRPVLRYGVARKMRATCLGCHNYDENSTKRDWQVGDVRGVVEIIRPLDRDVARARAGLRETFILMGVVAGSLLGLTVLFVVTGGRGSGAAKVV
jgi:eukaryotic-like serine/threonine-protein kinase